MVGRFGSLVRISAFFKRYWLFFFYLLIIIYLEMIYSIKTSGDLSRDFIFPVMFSVTAASFLYLLSGLLNERANMIISLFIVVIMIFVYGLYLIYYEIFKVPLSLYSIGGAGDALQFRSVIFEAIGNSVFVIILLLLPVSVLILLGRMFTFQRADKSRLIFSISLLMISFILSLAAVGLTKNKHNSQYMLYYKITAPQLSVSKLGLLTTIRLDLQKLIAEGIGNKPAAQEPAETSATETTAATTGRPSTTSTVATTQTTTETTTVTETTESVTEPEEPGFNMIDIDFDKLIESEGDPAIKEMHQYFASLPPSPKNGYTGIFEGNNLIFIVAESFYPYAIREDLTPTLYMMATEGFVFKNFYNPLFGVSTSDGEYVACTGLLPKPGVWSFYISGRNYMPFAFGNQFRTLDYVTKAYHNHTYTYYNRHLSHPNMGYDYKGVGNGLDVKVVWPESDLEMVEVTTDEYINDAPFHVYYLTVSGHLQYSFGGNHMAEKNRSAVEDLPLSTSSRAYLACHLEFEYAMAELVKRLDEAGELENTVIAISPDHYPYGLSKASIEELAGHSIESNFELYKGIFILWKEGMEPVTVDKYCSSLDISPTLSNMFGLEYDSRLMMGNDIFAETPPLVIFDNRSWITDRARYNSITNKVEFFDPDDYDKDYVTMIHNIVVRKFKYSQKILETDYYSKIRTYIEKGS